MLRTSRETQDEHLVYIDAIRHGISGDTCGMTVAVHSTPPTVAGHARFQDLSLALHMRAVDSGDVDPRFDVELLSAAGVVLRSTRSTERDATLSVIGEWMADLATIE